MSQYIDEELLDDLERKMNSGKQHYVLYEGNRFPFDQYFLKDNNIINGQAVNDVTLIDLQDKVINELEKNTNKQNQSIKFFIWKFTELQRL